MKRYSSTAFKASLLLFIFTFSCTNLDEEVYDKIVSDKFGVNEKQINAIIAPIYSSLQNFFPKAPWALAEASSNMSIVPTRKGGDWWGGGQWKDIEMHTWTPNTAYINGTYNQISSGISTSNRILYAIETSSASIPNKEQILAEIRGVRAFWYYMLIDFFGNGPLVADFTDLTLPSTTQRKDIYAFVMSELNEIKDKVRSDVSTASYGKMTKGAIYTLLAKMYLNAMVWNPQGGPKWQECVNACDVVMGMKYSLETNFKTNFQVNNEVSKEFILTAIYSKSSGGNNIAQQTLHYYDYQALGIKLAGWNGISAQPDLYKSFDPEDKRLKWSFLTGPMINPVTGKVIMTAHGRELIHTVDIIKKYSIDASGWGQVEQEDGARCSKWDLEPGLAIAAQENDYGIFRLADVYLMKAEALVRMNKDNDVATNLVNSIRERAFDSASKLYGSVTLTDVYNERRFELAWEGMGRQDQIRFGTFLDEIPGWKPASNNTNLLIFPLPQSVIAANPNLTQNPGY
jgi:hypothetical protein